MGEPDLDVVAAAASAPDLDRALAMVRAALTPASAATLAAALATLSTLTVRSSKGGESDADLQLAAYVHQLQAYPEDVALDVLGNWPRLSKWWPTWHELYERLERAVRYRRRAHAALEFARAQEASMRSA